MSCEIFEKNLVGYCFVGIDEANYPDIACPFEAGCPKTIEKCKAGKVLQKLELNSRIEFETPEDLEQDRILAQLEAQHNAKII